MQKVEDTANILSLLFQADQSAARARRFLALGKVEQAGPLLQQALELKQKALGSDDPGVADALDELGEHCLRLKDYPKAEDFLKRALEILEKAYYADHASVAPVVSHLGDCYVATNKWEEAEGAYKRALDIHSKTLVADHHDILDSTRKLAQVERKLGKLDDAEVRLKKALKTADTPLGPLEEFCYDLALTCQAAGKKDEAEAAYKDAIRAFEQRDKPHRLADCLDSYAKFLRSTDRSAEAEPLEKRARELCNQYRARATENTIYAATLMRA